MIMKDMKEMGITEDVVEDRTTDTILPAERKKEKEVAIDRREEEKSTLLNEELPERQERERATTKGNECSPCTFKFEIRRLKWNNINKKMLNIKMSTIFRSLS